MSSRLLAAIILAFSLGANAGFDAADVIRESRESARPDYLASEVPQLREINKAQAQELRRLKGERGE